jgi:hypothetical protein
VLPTAEARHAVRTLRCRVGEEAYLSNGQGLLARARFVEIKGERVVVEILEVWERPGEPPAPIALVVAILKAPDRMAWLVEKAVELGATHIFFVPFARSFPRQPSESRLRNVALAARQAKPAQHPPPHPGLPKPSCRTMGSVCAATLWRDWGGDPPPGSPSFHPAEHPVGGRPRGRLYSGGALYPTWTGPEGREPGPPAPTRRNRRPPLPQHPQNPLGILKLCRKFAAWLSS